MMDCARVLPLRQGSGKAELLVCALAKGAIKPWDYCKILPRAGKRQTYLPHGATKETFLL